jgi:hypothetical protein
MASSLTEDLPLEEDKEDVVDIEYICAEMIIVISNEE